eukprot:s658_g16.t1
MSVGSFTDYFRAIAWLILFCTWACLRLSDLEGLVPSRLQLGSRGLRGILVRTKTTGPGKQVREVPIFVSRRISLSGLDWLRCGYDIWKGLGFENRDYFVPSTNSAMDRVIGKFAPVERVAVYIRRVFKGLKVACKPRYQGWKPKEDEFLLDKVGVMYFTGHSMRHFLLTVAAVINISKEQRDYVGRWHVHLHQSADYIHSSRQIVTQVQEAVNQSIVEGVPSSYDESELIDDFGCFLLTKGRVPSEWIKQHGIWRGTEGKLMIGGKWPTMPADVIDSEVWAERGFLQEDGKASSSHAADGPAETEEEDKSSPFFVTVSRHSGFRRLHRVGCCSTQPWACHKVEYISRVTEDVADAVCKTCKGPAARLSRRPRTRALQGHHPRRKIRKESRTRTSMYQLDSLLRLGR